MPIAIVISLLLRWNRWDNKRTIKYGCTIIFFFNTNLLLHDAFYFIMFIPAKSLAVHRTAVRCAECIAGLMSWFYLTSQY